LYGLGLALFDSLLFPLLALDGLIFLGARKVMNSIAIALLPLPDVTHSGTLAVHHPGATLLGLAEPLAIVICAIIDWLIIRWAWRAAKRPVAGLAGVPTDDPTAESSTTGVPPVVPAARVISPVQDRVRESVKAPAIGLVVAAAISLAVLFAMTAVVTVLHRIPGVDIQPWVLAILMLALSPNIFVFFAAIWMLNLRGRTPAIVASVLAMLLSPGNIIGLPMGIWALVVLNRREVRDAFTAQRATRLARTRNWRKRLRKWLVMVPTLIVVAFLVKQYVLGVYRAGSDAVSPEITIGSRVFVYKLARTFEPGDIILYRRDGMNMLGRVVQDGPSGGKLMIERRDQAPQAVAIADVIGRVVFNTRSTARPTQPATQAESSPWRATLPSGVRVELLGVSENPSSGKPWWRPDGSPLAPAPFAGIGGRAYPQPGAAGREFAVRLGNLPREEAGSRWAFDPPVSFAGGGPVIVNGKAVRELRGIAVLAPAGRDTITVKYGVAAGPWTTVADAGREPATSSGKIAVTFSPAIEKDGGIVRTVTHNAADCDYRVVAVDNTGREIPGATESSGSAAFTQLTVTFPGLRLADVKEFRFQTRPYEWAEFKNVALRPAAVQPISQIAPATQPASSPTTQAASSNSVKNILAKFGAIGSLVRVPKSSTKWQIEASVLEGDILKVGANQEVAITLPAFSGRAFKGKVAHIEDNPTRDHNLVCYKVVIDIENPDAKFLPGMTAILWFAPIGADANSTATQPASQASKDEQAVFVAAESFLKACCDGAPAKIESLSLGSVEGWLSEKTEELPADIQGNISLVAGLYRPLLGRLPAFVGAAYDPAKQEEISQIQVAVKGDLAIVLIGDPRAAKELPGVIFKKTALGWRFVGVCDGTTDVTFHAFAMNKFSC
jgi:hypothetical protein